MSTWLMPPEHLAPEWATDTHLDMTRVDRFGAATLGIASQAWLIHRLPPGEATTTQQNSVQFVSEKPSNRGHWNFFSGVEIYWRGPLKLPLLEAQHQKVEGPRRNRASEPFTSSRSLRADASSPSSCNRATEGGAENPVSFLGIGRNELVVWRFDSVFPLV